MNFETWHHSIKQYSLLLSLPAISWLEPSYLWNDLSALDYHDDPDLVVLNYTLEARYPGLTPFNWAWQRVYEDASEMQACHGIARLDQQTWMSKSVGWYCRIPLRVSHMTLLRPAFIISWRWIRHRWQDSFLRMKMPYYQMARPCRIEYGFQVVYFRLLLLQW